MESTLTNYFTEPRRSGEASGEAKSVSLLEKGVKVGLCKYTHVCSNIAMLQSTVNSFSIIHQ